jgi:hypothetical protein
MPDTTWPNGAKPCPSSPALSLKLMNTWVVREFGPEVAKVMLPRLLLCFTASSGMRAARQAGESFGSPLMPNWTMKPEITRKKRVSS